MTDLLQESIAWSVAGFAGGWVTCWTAVWSALKGTHRGGKDMKTVRNHVWRVLFGVCILLLVVVSTIRYNSATECQTEYNKRVSLSITQRALANEILLDSQIHKAVAQKDFLLSLTMDREANRVLTHKYVETLEAEISSLQQLKNVRQVNPLDGAPNCGE